MPVHSWFVLTALAFLAGTFSAAGSEWMEDFEAARSKAEKEKKDILIDFTGSDWCGWCIKLKQEVFDQPAFLKAAPANFVLVELDFPRAKSQPEKIKKQNQALAAKFNVSGYPSIYLVDSKGRPYAKTGYQAGGPEKYLEHINGLRSRRVMRDDLFAKAELTTGIEKAKILDQALMILQADDVEEYYEDLIVSIIALDSDNKGGIKGKYEARKVFNEIGKIADSGDLDGAVKKLDSYMTEQKPTTTTKQEAYFLKSILMYHKKDKKGAIAALKLAQEAAPDSEKGKTIPDIIKKLSDE